MDNAAVVILAIIILGVVWRHIRRHPSTTSESFDGPVIAVEISLDGRARLKGNDDPLSVRGIVRHPDGNEWPGPWLRTSDLPAEVRRQVFAHSFAIEQYSPRLNLPREKNRQALEQARKKDDVYRFPLPTPVTVNAGRTTSGRQFIRGWD